MRVYYISCLYFIHYCWVCRECIDQQERGVHVVVYVGLTGWSQGLDCVPVSYVSMLEYLPGHLHTPLSASSRDHVPPHSIPRDHVSPLAQYHVMYYEGFVLRILYLNIHGDVKIRLTSTLSAQVSSVFFEVSSFLIKLISSD